MLKLSSLTTRLSAAARPSSQFRAVRGSSARAARTGRTAATVVPWGVAGALVLIVAIECFFARNWLEFTDPVSLSWRYSALATRSHVCEKDVLLVGDSLIKHALIPSVMAEVSGQRPLNLGAARCPTVMTYFLLRRALEAGATPRAIIFNAKPAVLIGGPAFTQRYWEEVLTAPELLQLFQIARGSKFIAGTLAGSLLPSLRSRLEIRSHLLANMRGEAGPLSEINRALWRNWTLNDGANVALPQALYDGVLTARDLKSLHPQVFYAEKSNVLGIDLLLRLAQQHDIPVFWLLPPLSPNLQSARERSGAEGAYEQFIRGYQARYPRTLTFLDARGAGYPAAAFTDATHLNARGAVVLSRAVAKEIALTALDRPAQDRPKWVTLEPWSDLSAGAMPALEDVEASRGLVRRMGPSMCPE